MNRRSITLIGVKNAAKGVLLAIVNAIAIALAITLVLAPPHRWPGMWSPQASELFVSTAIFALFSSIPLGALFGALAGRLRDNRLVVLELVALALVPICGTVTMRMLDLRATGDELCGLVVTACSPTILAVIALERWTRPAAPAPRALQMPVG